MKKLLLLLVPAIWLGMNGCEKTNQQPVEKGKIEFVLNTGNISLKSAPADSIPSTSFRLLVSLTGPDGATVIEDTSIAVYTFGDGLVSEKLKVEAGNYALVKFMLIDQAGRVLYAAPLQGSPKAYLVNNPLPVPFKVSAGEVTTIIPEVLSVNGALPSDFGYVSFGMKIVDPLPVFVMAVLDNPMVMSPTQITDADLIVSATDGWFHKFHLDPAINKIVIKGGQLSYTFEVLKEGYSPVKFHFSGDELAGTSESDPLILTISDTPMLSVLIKPGPEEGKDAMISDLEPQTNFGSWKYFEATFLTESPLTVMRTNRSLISFNMDAVPKGTKIEKVLLTLYMEHPLGWDSIYQDIAWYGAVLQQITQPWNENEVTWSNQPATTEANQVYVSPQPQLSTNARTYDVTSLYNTMLESPLPMEGIMFRLYPSPQFPGFRFASSDYPEAAMRPELRVFYSYLPD